MKAKPGSFRGVGASCARLFESLENALLVGRRDASALIDNRNANALSSRFDAQNNLGPIW